MLKAKANTTMRVAPLAIAEAADDVSTGLEPVETM